MNQDLNKLSKQELLSILEATMKAQSSGLMVKKNAAGGVYIRHSSFEEYSTAKNKVYVSGINIGLNTAKKLFNNPELIEQIKEQLKTM
jgi:hypothetical protein